MTTHQSATRYDDSRGQRDTECHRELQQVQVTGQGSVDASDQFLAYHPVGPVPRLPPRRTSSSPTTPSDQFLAYHPVGPVPRLPPRRTSSSPTTPSAIKTRNGGATYFVHLSTAKASIV
ncbi:hypothetical protein ACOMHN_025525 [Nucella lapillus]